MFRTMWTEMSHLFLDLCFFVKGYTKGSKRDHRNPDSIVAHKQKCTEFNYKQWNLRWQVNHYLLLRSLVQGYVQGLNMSFFSCDLLFCVSVFMFSFIITKIYYCNSVVGRLACFFFSTQNPLIRFANAAFFDLDNKYNGWNDVLWKLADKLHKCSALCGRRLVMCFVVIRWKYLEGFGILWIASNSADAGRHGFWLLRNFWGDTER